MIAYFVKIVTEILKLSSLHTPLSTSLIECRFKGKYMCDLLTRHIFVSGLDSIRALLRYSYIQSV